MRQSDIDNKKDQPTSVDLLRAPPAPIAAGLPFESIYRRQQENLLGSELSAYFAAWIGRAMDIDV